MTNPETAGGLGAAQRAALLALSDAPNKRLSRERLKDEATRRYRPKDEFERGWLDVNSDPLFELYYFAEMDARDDVITLSAYGRAVAATLEPTP